MAIIDYVLIGTIVLALFGFIYTVMTINKANRFRLREWNGNRSTVKDYLMLEKVNKSDNTPYWVTVMWQKRITVYDPPRDCMDLNDKGKKFLEAYKLSEDEFLFVKDTGFDSQTVLIKDGKKFQDGFVKFGTTERQVLTNSFQKALDQKQLSWKRTEIIVPAIAFISFAIIIVSLFVFWGDLAKPALESQRLAAQIQLQNIKIAQELGVRINNPEITVVTAEPSSGVSIVNDIGELIG